MTAVGDVVRLTRGSDHPARYALRHTEFVVQSVDGDIVNTEVYPRGLLPEYHSFYLRDVRVVGRARP